MSRSVCLIQKRGLFWWRRKCFLLKASKREFQLKREVHKTCLTPNLPDVSLAWQFMKFSSSICLTYHLSDKLKARRKFSLITHKLKVFISSAKHSSCPYGPVNKMYFVLVDFRLHEKSPNTELFLVCIFLYFDWIRGNTDQKKLLIWTVFAKWSIGFFREDFVTEDFFLIFLRHLLIYLFIYLFIYFLNFI